MTSSWYALTNTSARYGYNRGVKFYVFPVLAGVIWLGACNRGVETKEAVRQGVIHYLSSRSNVNVSSMQVDVTSVTFRGNEADATVSFRAKGSTGAGMTMNYTLEREGDRWVVKSRSETGTSPHGSMGGGGLPGGHPPVSGEQPSGSKK
jgi:hypothetical protein